MTKTREYKCGVILRCEEKILIVYQKASGLWGFPKGRKYENEEIFVCAKRELLEETGIDLDKLKFRRSHTHSIGCFRLFDVSLQTCITNIHIVPDEKEIEKIEWKTLHEIRDIPKEKCNNSIKKCRYNLRV